MTFDENENFGDGKQADNRNKEIDTVHEVEVASREARHAGLVVQTDHRDAKPDARGKRCLGLVVGCDAAEC